MYEHSAGWYVRWTAATLLAGLFVAWVVGWAVHRGDWLWFWMPDPAHVLGRDYTPGGSISHARLVAENPQGLQTVGHTALGEPFVTGDFVSPRFPTVIYLHEWTGGYVAYSLEGGP